MGSLDLHKTGWKCFFNSSWGRFESRFKGILESLARHADLVDREANAFLISETMQWRQEALQEKSRQERERSAIQFSAVLDWLGLENNLNCGQQHQEDVLDRLANDCCPGTTEWVSSQKKMKSWLRGSTPILWLKGKPGSGRNALSGELAVVTDNGRQKHNMRQAREVSACR